MLIKAKKYWGQNFLTSFEYASQFVDTLNIDKQDIIIEIGPGQGIITELCLQNAKQVIAVEIDKFLAGNLKRSLSRFSNLTVVNQNILDFDPQIYNLKNTSYKIIGSLPYNISKQIISKFLTCEIRPSVMSFIVQKEVALDYSSCPPKSTFLSNYSRIFADVTYIKTIPKEVFDPRPKVDGAIIKFKVKNTVLDSELKKQITFIKQGFLNQRKMLQNNKTIFNKLNKEEIDHLLQSIHILPLSRASNLTLEDWIELFKKVSK